MRIAFLHPDLGIGGAERLIVDAAIGLQALGHTVDLYTSHHDLTHCFEETKDGSLRVHHIPSPFPRSWRGKFHVFFAHASQLHLTQKLLRTSAAHDVYFVDQLSTCIPLLRLIAGKRVVFYCHFPDKLLAHGEYVEGTEGQQRTGFLKRLYRLPMDWLEEITTRQADIILANSEFTSRVFQSHFRSIRQKPQVVYPGINIAAYQVSPDPSDEDVKQVVSNDRLTLLSLNRFEKKKNASLAVHAFALLKADPKVASRVKSARLVLAGGYDPRLEDNVTTLINLIDTVTKHSLTYDVCTPSPFFPDLPLPNRRPADPDVLFVLNFTTAQRSALLGAPSTAALLYTPANEHFGIGPVEAMIARLPVLACDSGGPTESVADGRTGWLRPPDPQAWAEALVEILSLSEVERTTLGARERARAEAMFGMEAMAKGLEGALRKADGMGPVRIRLNPMLAILGVLAVFLASFLLSHA